MPSNEISLYTADVGPLEDPELFLRLYQCVSETRREKVDRVRPPRGKLLSLGAGVLLEAALAELGLPAPRLEQDENGKPYLPNDNHFFNISHSGTRVLCAVSDHEIGCDVEKVRAAPLRVARRYFCSEEYQALLDCKNEPERDRLFFRLWTLKESFLKAIGLGFRLPPNAFCIQIRQDAVSVRQQLDPRSFFFRSFYGADYEYALCSVELPLKEVPLTERNFPDLADLLSLRSCR
jgi:4'-phosphopantetheinyl transferase